MSKPLKRSVAVVIRRGDLILSVRRADDDDELAGIWGLPAGTLQGPETVEHLIRRIGAQKLGVGLSGLRKLADGSQDRPRYLLEMELWEAEMTGVPQRAEWQWAELNILEPGRTQGSFCCDLALKVLGGSD